MSDTVEKWTPEQVIGLNASQQRGDRHPYTCPGNHPHCEQRRKLIATSRGWVCNCGEYKQGWAHGLPKIKEPSNV